MLDEFRGNYIGGRFVAVREGEAFSSHDPAHDDRVVLTARTDPGAVDAAVAAARAAFPAWRRADRAEALKKVQAAVERHAERIAAAITAEMGKTITESRAEAKGIAAKIGGVIDTLSHELPGAYSRAPGEQRFHPLGVVAVIGPFNFPVHLLNTHVIPALLTGNTVVCKVSEVTPLSGQRYAELFDDAGFPPGVFNLVQGLGGTGAALAGHTGIQGLVFTGSYRTGRLIRQQTFDQPYKKVALELGGKNPAVVLDDADLQQAEREILLGALLSTGQRCTATSRVIVTPGVADRLRERLAYAFARVLPGDPKSEDTFMGPLANAASRDRFQRLLAEGREQGAKVLVESRMLDGGAYVTPGLYEVRGHERLIEEELFGPHVCFEVALSEADAFARAGRSGYGLSASLFSASEESAERFYEEVPAGVININRSTNGASGLLPFGGVGRSGNWWPAASAAPRICTYPVAVMSERVGTRTDNAQLDLLLGDG